MKSAMFALACAMLVGNAANHDAPWVGVWRAFLDGQPSAALTLADDTGSLGGTLVLEIIVRDGGGAHIAANETHVLLGVHIDGKTMRFAVRKRDGELMTFTLILGDGGKANLHCVSCGDAPVVEMTKDVFGKANSD